MSGLNTVPESDLRTARRARAGRRVLLVAYAAVLVCGATGVFGPRRGVAEASGGGYTLRVEYPSTTRPGLAVQWQVTVTKEGGFGDEPVMVAARSEWFDLFDTNALDPSPASARTGDGHIVWEFDPPDGDLLTITYDARVQPGTVRGASGRTAVVEEERSVVEVSYETRLWP